MFFIFSMYNFKIGYIPKRTMKYPAHFGARNKPRHETAKYVIKAVIDLYLKMQIPITIEDAKRRAAFAGRIVERYTSTRQSAQHIPPPEILFVLISIAPLSATDTRD